MAYVIVKRYRDYTNGPGYEGPSCDATGIEKGKIYVSKHEAQLAADTLSWYNPVGFNVVEFIPEPTTP
jgi:hypothetical protein